ncbi:hypothetical protein EOD41_11600 [Mucilaginibacter limnophilus]|uniref:chorismate mutase n=1 Tax=Mucilaginibacter limnophilus TaxID=1932778 RepID=A0A437MSK4_9SPHI|nr:chorismate mutase [Mucilaginibacter limnophilus]RVU00639.1 hypothetical protein EOD41_11600 [Mucilaginibacter limnophilus]
MKKYILLLSCFIGLGITASAQTKTQDEINADLAVHRKQIDSLDKLMIHIIAQRQQIVREVGVYKKKYNVPPLQPARFKQVVDRAILAGQQEGLSAEFITQLMNAIHDESLRIEGDTTTKH